MADTIFTQLSVANNDIWTQSGIANEAIYTWVYIPGHPSKVKL